MTADDVPHTTPLVIGAVPVASDIEWLCRHPGHSLVMVDINGEFYPVIQDERGEGPVIPFAEAACD